MKRITFAVVILGATAALARTAVSPPPKDLSDYASSADKQLGNFTATANRDAYTLSSDAVFSRINFEVSDQDPVILDLCGHVLTVNADGAAAEAFRAGNGDWGSGTRVVITNGTVRQVCDTAAYPGTVVALAVTKIGSTPQTHDFKVEIEKGGVLDACKLTFPSGTNNVLRVKNGGRVLVGDGGLTVFDAASVGHRLQVDADAAFESYFDGTVYDEGGIRGWRPNFRSARGCCVSLGSSAPLADRNVTQIQPASSDNGSGNVLELRGPEFSFTYAAPTSGDRVNLAMVNGSGLKVLDGATLDFGNYRFWAVDTAGSQFVVSGANSTVTSTNNSAFNVGYADNATYLVDDGGLLDLSKGILNCGVAGTAFTNLNFIVRNGGTVKVANFVVGANDDAKPHAARVVVDGGSILASNNFYCPNSTAAQDTQLEISGKSPKIKAYRLSINNPQPEHPTTVVFDIPAGGYAEAPLESTAEKPIVIESGVRFVFNVEDPESLTKFPLAKSEGGGFTLGEGVLAAMNAALPAEVGAEIRLSPDGTELLFVKRRGFLLMLTGRPVFIVNGDNDHWFVRSSELMNETAMRAYIDEMASGGAVTHFFMCAQGQRASYDSKVTEPIWAGLNEQDELGNTNHIWCTNAKLCHDRGLDVYSIWADHCRSKGISPWISMRMNDLHGVMQRNHYRTENFWRSHPELRRVPNVDPVENPNRAWEDFAYDYSKEEVRTHQFAIFRELVERYDVDGYELDWMRFPCHLTPGREREQSGVLTDFIRDCHTFLMEVSRRRGRRIRLAARVPSSYEAARGLGYDPEAWARDGLVDLILVANFYGTVDYDFDFPGWCRRIRAANSQVQVLPSAANFVGCTLKPREILMEELFGWADVCLAEGARGHYLFNVDYMPQAMKAALYGRGLASSVVAASPRTYVATYHDCVPDPSMRNIQFPVRLADGPVNVRLNCGTGRARFAVHVRCAFDSPSVPTVHVRLNGSEAWSGPVPQSCERDRFGTQGGDVSAAEWSFSPVAVKPGENTVYIEPGNDVGGSVIWCELSVE